MYRILLAILLIVPTAAACQGHATDPPGDVPPGAAEQGLDVLHVFVNRTADEVTFTMTLAPPAQEPNGRYGFSWESDEGFHRLGCSVGPAMLEGIDCSYSISDSQSGGSLYNDIPIDASATLTGWSATISNEHLEVPAWSALGPVTWTSQAAVVTSQGGMATPRVDDGAWDTEIPSCAPLGIYTAGTAGDERPEPPRNAPAAATGFTLVLLFAAIHLQTRRN